MVARRVIVSKQSGRTKLKIDHRHQGKAGSLLPWTRRNGECQGDMLQVIARHHSRMSATQYQAKKVAEITAAAKRFNQKQSHFPRWPPEVPTQSRQDARGRSRTVADHCESDQRRREIDQASAGGHGHRQLIFRVS